MVSSDYSFWQPWYKSIEVSADKTVAKADYAETVGTGAFIEFNLRWNNGLDATLIDRQGLPITNAKLSLTPTKDPSQRDRELYGGTGSNKFGVSGIEPGSYRLSAEIRSPFGKAGKLIVHYLEATNLIFTPQSKHDLVFTLPKDLIRRRIVGEVQTVTGGSVGGYVRVSLDSHENRRDPQNIEFGSMAIDAKGEFAFDAFEGEEYWLHVWLSDPGIETKNLKTEKLIVGREQQKRIVQISLPPLN